MVLCNDIYCRFILEYFIRSFTVYILGCRSLTPRSYVPVSQVSYSSIAKKGKKESHSRNRPWRHIGLCDNEASTFSLDNQLTDGGEVVSLKRRPLFTPQEDSWYSFLLEAESTPGP
jgi:hypothetical protein